MGRRAFIVQFYNLYYKELENGKADTLSRKTNYFKGKK